MMQKGDGVCGEWEKLQYSVESLWSVLSLLFSYKLRETKWGPGKR